MTSCTSYTATGAMTGGMAGSLIGGMMGGYHGSNVGALVGMAAGAAMGAAAEQQERERYEERMRRYDDVYNTPGVYRDVEKAKRIQSYHNKVKHGGTRSRGGNDSYRDGYRDGYGDAVYNGNSSNTAKSAPKGFRFEKGNDPMAGKTTTTTTTTTTTSTTNNEAGYSENGGYDDRIEIK